MSTDQCIEYGGIITGLDDRISNVKASLIEDKSNAIRKGDIVNYYSDMYSTYSRFLMEMCFILAVIVLIKYVGSYVLPKSIIKYSILTIATIGIFYLMSWLYTLTHRSNMDFNKHEFKRASVIAASHTDYSDTGVKCKGAACCPYGTTYDTAARQCRLN